LSALNVLEIESLDSQKKWYIAFGVLFGEVILARKAVSWIYAVALMQAVITCHKLRPRGGSSMSFTRQTEQVQR